MPKPVLKKVWSDKEGHAVYCGKIPLATFKRYKSSERFLRDNGIEPAHKPIRVKVGWGRK